MSWSFLLADLKTDAVLADITDYCLTSVISPRLNRPMQMTFTLPSDQAFLHALAFDGDPCVHVGNRTIKAYQDGTLRGNGIIWTANYSGGPDNDPRVDLICADPVLRLNYRTVFDSIGRLADPDFTYLSTSGDPAAPVYNAAAILQAAIINSLTYEDNFGDEAILPIDIFGGVFSATANISSILTDTPVTIGELYTLLVDTGVVDVTCTPVDTSFAGITAGQIGRLNILNEAGSDISATVHFDYGTGLCNVASATRTLDMTTLGNRLTYELGPKNGRDRFRGGNITGTELTPVDLSAWQTLARASRRKYGTFAEVTVFDSDGDDVARPLFHALWKTETVLRVNPRDLLYLTPQAGLSYRPFIDFNLGDRVGVNSSYFLGPPIAGAKQRIYGFDVTISNTDGVERVAQLITSADAENGPTG